VLMVTDRDSLWSALLVFITVPSLGAFGRSPQRSPSQYLNTAPGVRYVGSKACARCHQGVYDEYSRTLMGRSMALPSDASLPKPPAPIKVHDGKRNRDYEILN
jgi:hypothetical protein